MESIMPMTSVTMKAATTTIAIIAKVGHPTAAPLLGLGRLARALSLPMRRNNHGS